jgi:DNA-binding GntR family transcriptional regulator
MRSKSRGPELPDRPNSVADVLKQRIREGTLAPGARLVEGRIAAETGTTRTHVREALLRLAGEGLVVIENFRGASVRQLNAREVTQIFATRQVLEGLAARQAALAPATARDAVRERQERLDACEKQQDAAGFAAANEAWHLTIIGAADNPYAQSFLERLWIPTYRLSFRRVYTPEIMARSNLQHRLVTAAIVAGRPEEADVAMRLHVHSGLELPAAAPGADTVAEPKPYRP